MKRKIFFYFVLITFIITLIYGVKFSYSKYIFQVESEPITLNTKSYSNLVISSIVAVENEENTYNITVNNTNNYDVNFFAEAKNSNDLSQSINVVMDGAESDEEGTEYWTVSANDTITVKVTLEKDEVIDYTENENNEVEIALNIKGIYPYKAADVINNTDIALAPEVVYEPIPVSEYGRYVDIGTNILPRTEGVITLKLEGDEQPLSDWRVFSSSSEGTWLILSDYLTEDKLPETLTAVTFVGSPYRFGIENTSDKETAQHVFFDSLSDKNAWKPLIAENEELYANNNVIVKGAFRVQEWANNWNAHSNYTQIVVSEVVGSTGFLLNGNGEVDISENQGYDDTLYFPHKSKIELCRGYWIDDNQSAVLNYYYCTNYAGVIKSTHCLRPYHGFRPCVFLPSSISFDTSEEVWTIAE